MIILAIILGLLPGLAWLLFYLKEDLHPEPKRLIALTFFAGIAATIFALVAQSSVLCFFINPCRDVELTEVMAAQPILTAVIMVIVFALIEEIVKFGAAYITVNKNTEFNEPVDAMIYVVVASLGFATVENLAYAYRILGPQFAQGITSLGDALRIISLRFVGATLLHALSGAIVGYYWAKSIRRFEAKRFIVWGIIIATGLHASFNYLIIQYDQRFYPVLLLAAVGFLILGDFEKLKRKSI